ncbi:hypothetical protein TC41_2398 [Alicyclobacillus acidocaldarius subsp. acidocaldarius Tc-4-1]|uniref:Uncharacterized protein n=2 Tax=Alicyclobacillus acidocaldarius TaxID=405212 RepID=F8IGL8_ALIAT|nr:hypothetical protein TC41_2398 [Alicyclobacillus acidocaldarius subsp. acidocaldarius Tc-4-1]
MLCIFVICAVTDVLYRRVSETVLILGAVAILVADVDCRAPWWLLLALVLSGVSLGGLWWMVDRDHALGDAEMVGVMGLGLGVLALVPLFLALLLALVTRPLWPVLAGPQVNAEERPLAPMGVYFFLGLVCTILASMAVLRP